ncbi:MAG: chorismate-binding protein [Bdellovibrionales bacterium]|nr:chorismate-binding protein [Bdellovibrionales bacterium]
MEGISSGRIQKVVAARSETYRCRDFPRIEELEERLFSLSDGVHRFFLETPWGVFLGASPEYLFHRQGDRVIVPAIAGSAAPEKAHSLLRGSKERLEHDLVIREIEQSLRGLGLNPKRGETSVLPLQHLHHLFTPVEARTAGGAARALLRALHPTPALGGYPRRAASEFLRKEPLQRGFFGAPLGFWSKEEDRMLVAIRCALVRGGTATLFAGAGVVNGSSAEAEWRETHRKMSAMRAILGIPEVGGEG